MLADEHAGKLAKFLCNNCSYYRVHCRLPLLSRHDGQEASSVLKSPAGILTEFGVREKQIIIAYGMKVIWCADNGVRLLYERIWCKFSLGTSTWVITVLFFQSWTHVCVIF